MRVPPLPRSRPLLAALLLGACTLAPGAVSLARPAEGSPSRPKLVYAGDAYFPPFEYKDVNGRARGFNVELVSVAADEAGYDVEFRLGPWSGVVASLEN